MSPKATPPAAESTAPPPPASSPAPLTNWTTDPKLLGIMAAFEGNRTMPYVDTKGYYTIGIGRNLSTRGLTSAEVMLLYRTDVQLCSDTMDREIPWWRKLNDDCQRAMISLCFMGWETFAGFHRFMAAMEHMANPPASAPDNWIKSWIEAAHQELKASLWWGEVGQRGPKTIDLIHA